MLNTAMLNTAMFIGFMTDHLISDQMPVDPDINHFDILKNTPYPPNDYENPTGIKPEDTLPQYMNFLVMRVLTLAFPLESNTENHPATRARVQIPLCFAYSNNEWVKLILPDTESPFAHPARLIIINPANVRKYTIRLTVNKQGLLCQKKANAISPQVVCWQA